MRRADAVKFRQQIEAVFDKAAPTMSADETIEARALCKAWKAGIHTAGETYTTPDGQIWTCIQGYNNEHHPGVTPGSTAWGTFHKPYHGTSRETTLPWVQPTGAHDMYLAGEFMIWTDGEVYRCLQGTNFNPEEYGAAWEIQR